MQASSAAKQFNLACSELSFVLFSFRRGFRWDLLNTDFLPAFFLNFFPSVVIEEEIKMNVAAFEKQHYY